MKTQTWYLAGPMTGIPQFNFPLFERAAKDLRDRHGLNIVSPTELDAQEGIREKALASDNGQLGDAHIEETWGDLLARDVKLIADKVTGVVFLPDWQRSRGARLEAFVAMLCGHDFARYIDGVGMGSISKKSVAAHLAREMYEDIRNG